jgi:hypothetical protein
VYPGAFDPPTIAHLALAGAAVERLGATRVDLAISARTLAKPHLGAGSIERRRALLAPLLADRPWLGLVVVEAELVVDIAQGYDLVLMGADKWAQVNDPAWYGGDAAERDRALARLPRVAVAPRAGFPHPGELALELPEELAEVSSTAVRAGRSEWAAVRPG